MSSANGTVTFNDGTVMHCEYYGTVDLMVPTLYETKEECHENWKNHVRNECTCGNLEPVTIYSDYGGGFEWEGEACRTCKAINHEHLDSDWEANKAYREQRNNPWGWF